MCVGVRDNAPTVCYQDLVVFDLVIAIVDKSGMAEQITGQNKRPSPEQCEANQMQQNTLD